MKFNFDPEHVWCRQDGRGNCIGMHCAFCGEACGSQGHWACYEAVKGAGQT